MYTFIISLTLSPLLPRIIWLQDWQQGTLMFPAETAGMETGYCLKWPERRPQQVAFISGVQTPRFREAL